MSACLRIRRGLGLRRPLRSMAASRRPHDSRRRTSSGFTLVEVLVGVAISLAIIAGALATAGLQLGEHHRLMLELQVQQDLRATAELMLHDLRRAGFRDRPQDAVWREDRPARDSNPPADITVDDAGRRITYSFARGDVAVNGGSNKGSGSGASIDPATDVRETSGFRFAQGRLDQLIAGRHQPLTDPAVLRIVGFQAWLGSIDHALGDLCPTPCLASECGPFLRSLQVRFVIEAEAVHDARVKHRIEAQTRIRNDSLSGSCS